MLAPLNSSLSSLPQLSTAGTARSHTQGRCLVEGDFSGKVTAHAVVWGAAALHPAGLEQEQDSACSMQAVESSPGLSAPLARPEQGKKQSLGMQGLLSPGG